MLVSCSHPAAPGLPQRSEEPQCQRIRCLPAARETPRGGQGLALSVGASVGREGGQGRGVAAAGLPESQA